MDTSLEALIEEFDKDFNIFGECNPPHCSNMRWFGDLDKLQSFILKAHALGKEEAYKEIKEYVLKQALGKIEELRGE